MKHLATIEAILAMFHQPWMNAEDKAEMNQRLINASGRTLEQWDADIETGVRNGHSVEDQLKVAHVVATVDKICERHATPISPTDYFSH